MSGIVIDGHIVRFAACQLGQKTAGSPWEHSSLAGPLPRSLARSIHVASWADELIFITATTEHGSRAGCDGGFPACMEYHGRVLKVQQMLVGKARALKTPLSAKGHGVGQRGSHTWIGVDSSSGRFSTLSEKLPSMQTAHDRLAAAATSTGGPVLSLGCEARLRLCNTAAQSRLSRPPRHRCRSPCIIGRRGWVRSPTLAEEREAEFDWGPGDPGVGAGPARAGIHAHGDGEVWRLWSADVASGA